MVDVAQDVIVTEEGGDTFDAIIVSAIMEGGDTAFICHSWKFGGYEGSDSGRVLLTVAGCGGGGNTRLRH